MNTFPGNSFVREFEYKVATYCDVKHCLSVCNATTGIWGVFYSLGLANAEIITTPLTWPGAFSGLKMLNCKLKFCDVEPENLTINPDLIEEMITEDTRAVFSADFLGYPARLDKIKKVCDKYDLLLIHDAASSFGSKYNGFYSGNYADVTILSFGAKKIFSIGEGGCVLTNDNKIYECLVKALMHPERQGVELNQPNSFALNTSIHPIAAQYGVEHFEQEVEAIEEYKFHSRNWITQNLLSKPPESDEPNYYKVISRLDQLLRAGSSMVSLPFNLIYKETEFSSGGDTRRIICPVAEDALIKYKIVLPC